MKLRVAAALAVATVLLVGCTSAPPATTTTTVPAEPVDTTLPVVPTSTTTTVIAPPATATVPVMPPPEPAADPGPPAAGLPAPEGSRGVAIVAAGGAALRDTLSGDVTVRAREGLPMPVTGREGSWFRLLTPCDTEAWVNSAEVRFVPSNTIVADSIESAVIVLDPGHGGPNRGATGPTGLAEPEVNLDIARRARDLLNGSWDIDWRTGAVVAGSSYGPAAAVWMTRAEGPPGADYEAGLLFRATFAEMAGAEALVSIHNNAEPDGPFDGPGSEAYYSIRDSESRRLAGLMVEEFRREFASFDVDWVGDTDAGAKYRLNDAGGDYYGVIRMSTVPVVIAEGAFISSPAEEDLLRTSAFRQAYAEAVYRALVRFTSTDDLGSGFTDPYPRTIPSGSGAPLPTCRVPEQPAS